jgi:hypothetical protein
LDVREGESVRPGMMLTVVEMRREYIKRLITRSMGVQFSAPVAERFEPQGSGICENCDNYAEELVGAGSMLVCESCVDELEIEA